MRNHARRVLIIDPDLDLAHELCSRFLEKGYDAENCKGITEAIQRIKNVKFSCVIMDTQIPEMMGYEAVPILKALDPLLKIIMTTSENSRELEIKVREQEIFYYYIKSFDRKELEQAVSNVFQRIPKTR